MQTVMQHVGKIRMPLLGEDLRVLLAAFKQVYGPETTTAGDHNGWLQIVAPQPATQGDAP